jgi:LDH2 family malate/lactate/ureidoglycolate dehydrogenase
MANQDATSQKIPIAASEAERFIKDVLQANGIPAENASIIARCLVAADLRGVDTHGMNRIPSYMERIRQGVLSATAQPILTQVTPAVAQVDGQNGFGFVAAHKGMAAAIESAKIFGIGMASSGR